MSKGGFACHVKMTKVGFGGGFNEGIAYFSGDIELKGYVLQLEGFDISKVKSSPTYPNGTRVRIDIEFAEEQERSCWVSDGSYIGDMHALENTKDNFDKEIGIDVSLRLQLRRADFDSLAGMAGNWLRVETVHERAKNLTEGQRSDGLYALIKRVYFGRDHEFEEPNQRSFLRRVLR
ncbi:MAG: hypothetical protein ACREU8_08230 [Gammaproteobacteria bacterium]